ncbi:MAG: hypothetical protein ABRQ38_20065, partial [Candidatus Eremiobacterota bacterium]
DIIRKARYKLKQCAWCRKVKDIDTGIWTETSDIIQDISHTICPECKKRLWKNYLDTCDRKIEAEQNHG